MRKRRRTEITIETHRRVEVRWLEGQRAGGEPPDGGTASQEKAIVPPANGDVLPGTAPKKKTDPA
jgi:hypothetical protein